jgi:hypothetical protein
VAYLDDLETLELFVEKKVDLSNVKNKRGEFPIDIANMMNRQNF